MKTFGFTNNEKLLILDYLMANKLNRRKYYTNQKWEVIKKQRFRARKAIKPFLDPEYVDGHKSLSTLDFDSLSPQRRIYIDDNDVVIHKAVDIKHINEEITNYLRRIINRHSKYVYGK